MAFDPKALVGMTKRIKERNTGGTSRVFNAKRDLQQDSPVLIRLRKPLPNQGGEWNYALEVVTYWFKKKPYISRAVFGEEDVLAPLMDEVRGYADDKSNPNSKLFKALLDDFQNHSVDTSFWMPVAFINVDDDGETFTGLTSKQDILAANPTLADQINDIVLSDKVIKKSPVNGIFDGKKGFAISISKSKTGPQKTDVKYKAERDEQVEMPDDLWADDKAPDIMQYLQKIAPSAEYSLAAFNNYFYGDEMPEKDVWKAVVEDTDDEPEEEVAQPVSRPASSNIRKPVAADKPVAAVGKSPSPAPATKAPAPVGAAKKEPAKPASAAPRNIVDDLENEFEDD